MSNATTWRKTLLHSPQVLRSNRHSTRKVRSACRWFSSMGLWCRRASIPHANNSQTLPALPTNPDPCSNTQGRSRWHWSGRLGSKEMKLPGEVTRNLLFTGKGGVGKTSVACATAISLADEGKRVLLVSRDE